jgi:predicted DNA binding CopG/RHH family protein
MAGARAIKNDSKLTEIKSVVEKAREHSGVVFTPVTLKFDPLVLKKIKMLARKRGISYNSYIRYLVAKSVEKEMIPAGR